MGSEEDRSKENEKGGVLSVLFMPIHWIYILGLVIAVVFASYLFYPLIENFFVFYPYRPLEAVPENMGLQYRDAYFDAVNGETLHGWYFPNQNEGPVILFCHGNAGNISHRLDHVSRLLAKGLRVFIFDYRGYGKSRGSPSEKGVYLDGVAAYDYLTQREEIRPEDIVAYGHSLGAAVAIEIALRKKVKALIIESAFTSIREMASSMVLFRVFAAFLPNHYDNLEKLPRARVPVLVMHGEADELVPFSMGEKLYQAARAPRFFYPIKGAAHNDTYLVGGEKYFQTFATFARHSRI
ncbi:MAG: alpha/beta hydrolase [Thermodesulfobacteriota bacterium]